MAAQSGTHPVGQPRGAWQGGGGWGGQGRGHGRERRRGVRGVRQARHRQLRLLGEGGGRVLEALGH